MVVTNNISDGQLSHSVQFRPQSTGIEFTQWIALFTLCLAPLLAHVIAGVPNYVHLHAERPKWHEWIVHYNPNSIIWRYFAIIDRRIRARTWDDLDMAASNACFWTAHGWDGSEEMMIKSREFCLQDPPAIVERLVSLDMVKTAIITLQGVQAIYGVLREWFLALDTIFAALAVFGLLRLPAALWLTSDYVMVDPNALLARRQSTMNTDDGVMGYEMHTKTSNTTPRTAPQMTTTATSQYSLIDSTLHNKFRRTTSLQGLFIRAIYLVILFGLALMWLHSAFPEIFNPNSEGGYTVTSVMVIIFYGAFLLAAIVLFLYYFITRRALPSTTALPCMGTLWYKVYTCFLMIMSVLTIVFASLETRRSPCGTYTEYPSSVDHLICPGVFWINSTSSQ